MAHLPGAGSALSAEQVTNDATAATESAKNDENDRLDGPGPVPGPERSQYCWLLLTDLSRRWSPTRPLPDMTAAQQWPPVTAWADVIEFLENTGSGARAYIRLGRPNRIGHAIALYHTHDQGLVVINPEQPAQRPEDGYTIIVGTQKVTDWLTGKYGTPDRLDTPNLRGTPARLGTRDDLPLIDAHVLFQDPNGQVIHPPLGQATPPSKLVQALTDPTDPYTGMYPFRRRRDRTTRTPRTGNRTGPADRGGRRTPPPAYQPPASPAPDYAPEQLPDYSERSPGDCLMYALHDTAFHVLPPEAHTVRGMRNRLADALFEPTYQAAVWDQARQSLAEDHARGLGHQQGTRAWTQAVNTHRADHPQPDWGRLITDLRTPGSWNNAAGDIAPLLAAGVFHLAITVHGPHNTRYQIGDPNGTPIDLWRNGTHWEGLTLAIDEDALAGGENQSGWTQAANLQPPSAPASPARRQQPARPSASEARTEYESDLQRLRNDLQADDRGYLQADDRGYLRVAIDALFRSLRGVGDDELIAQLGPDYAIENRNGNTWFLYRPAGAQTQQPAGNEHEPDLHRLRNDLQADDGGYLRVAIDYLFPSLRGVGDDELIAQLGPDYAIENRYGLLWFLYRPTRAQTQRPTAGTGRAGPSEQELRDAARSGEVPAEHEGEPLSIDEDALTAREDLQWRTSGFYVEMGDNAPILQFGRDYEIGNDEGRTPWYIHRPAGAQTQQPTGNEYGSDLQRLRNRLQTDHGGYLRVTIDYLFPSLRGVGDDELIAQLGPDYAIENRHGLLWFLYRPTRA
ncbi:OTU domain-containing protein, partial [Actinoallomurus soli]|uniref:OTU domain-containing protein n=1 Tax=Actinoallomurus soli TaxID=2952535 RepID=UPI00209254C0